MTKEGKEIERVPTGIEGLDPLIGGGFPQGKAFLLSGEPGTGKTLFSMQYLLHGASKGEHGIYVAIDEKPDHVISDAEAIGWDIKSYLDKGLIQVLDVSSYFANARLGKKESIDVKQIVSDLTVHIKEVKAKRLVIDPVAPLIFHQDSRAEVSEYVRNLVFSIEDNTGCTTILTSHVPVGSGSFSQYGVEEFIASGVILLRVTKPDNKYIRTIFVRKMRSTAVDLTEYAFEIVKGRGLVLRQPV
jgi:circadian clock protein KaiC